MFTLQKRIVRIIYGVGAKSSCINLITYAAETWCLKAKTMVKLSSTEMDFWRHSARISRKDKIRNTVIKQKMNVTRSLPMILKQNNFSGTDMFKEWKREDYLKKL